MKTIITLIAFAILTGCAASVPTSIPAGQPETLAELEEACSDRGGLVLDRRTGTRIRKPLQPDELVGAACRR